jgi:hypothetical protein
VELASCHPSGASNFGKFVHPCSTHTFPVTHHYVAQIFFHYAAVANSNYLLYIAIKNYSILYTAEQQSANQNTAIDCHHYSIKTS